MRDRRSTIGSAFETRTGSDGESVRSQSRIRRMRSSVFGTVRQEESQPSRRRSTIVGAILKPQRSFLNLIGRRNTASQPQINQFEAERPDVDDAQSVATVRAVVDQEIDEPRESVEGTLVGSSVFSRTDGGHSIYDDQTESDSDTLRAWDLRNGERRVSSDSTASVQTVEHLPRRALRRTSQIWRKSLGNLRSTAFLDSLRNVETPGQTPEDALSALGGGAGSSTVRDAHAAVESGATESAPVGSAHAPRKFSRLSVGDILGRFALRSTGKAAAAAEETAISPKDDGPGMATVNDLLEAAALRQHHRLLQYEVHSLEDYQALLQGYANEHHPHRESDAKDDAQDKRNDSAQQTEGLSPEVAKEVRHLSLMLDAKPDMASTRSRSSTIECEVAFDPHWRPNDPREYSRRHHMSELYGSEAVDQWEVVKVESKERERPSGRGQPMDPDIASFLVNMATADTDT